MSDLYWRCVFAQVSVLDFASGKAVADMHYEEYFSSSKIKKAKRRSPTVEKEGYAIVGGFKRGEWIFYGGVAIFSLHINLACITSRENC